MARRGGLAVIKFLKPRRWAGLLPGKPDVGLPEEPGGEVPEGPEVEPPDTDDEVSQLPSLPVIPAEPDDPEIWPPLDLVPPPGPLPEYFYVACYHESIGLRHFKVHVPSMKQRLQALKDRLPAGGVGGRPPDRPLPTR